MADDVSMASLRGHTHPPSDFVGGSIKSTVMPSFPLAKCPEAEAEIAAILPAGIIIMWSGSSLPAGWVLCDGSNGTPDLRERMVIGASSTIALGSRGGADTMTLSTLPSHTHSGTLASASHSHTMTFSGSGAKTTTADGDHTHTLGSAGAHSHGGPSEHGTSANGEANAGRWTLRVDGRKANCFDGGRVTQFNYGHTHHFTSTSWPHTHTFGIAHTHSTSSAAAHTHTVTIGSTGSASPASFSIMPSYYKLAFIMKA